MARAQKPIHRSNARDTTATQKRRGFGLPPRAVPAAYGRVRCPAKARARAACAAPDVRAQRRATLRAPQKAWKCVQSFDWPARARKCGCRGAVAVPGSAKPAPRRGAGGAGVGISDRRRRLTRNGRWCAPLLPATCLRTGAPRLGTEFWHVRVHDGTWWCTALGLASAERAHTTLARAHTRIRAYAHTRSRRCGGPCCARRGASLRLARSPRLAVRHSAAAVALARASIRGRPRMRARMRLACCCCRNGVPRLAPPRYGYVARLGDTAIRHIESERPPSKAPTHACPRRNSARAGARARAHGARANAALDTVNFCDNFDLTVTLP